MGLTRGLFNWEQVEQQLKKALAEDPNAFDYDGVYEEMKGNQARPIHEDRAKREVDASIFVRFSCIAGWNNQVLPYMDSCHVIVQCFRVISETQLSY